MAGEIATAFVLVKPDLTDFAKELRTGIEAQLTGKPPPIKVQPVVTQKALQEMKATISAQTANVKVTPVVSGTKQAANDAARQLSENLSKGRTTIDVPPLKAPKIEAPVIEAPKIPPPDLTSVKAANETFKRTALEFAGVEQAVAVAATQAEKGALGLSTAQELAAKSTAQLTAITEQELQAGRLYNANLDESFAALRASAGQTAVLAQETLKLAAAHEADTAAQTAANDASARFQAQIAKIPTLHPEDEGSAAQARARNTAALDLQLAAQNRLTAATEAFAASQNVATEAELKAATADKARIDTLQTQTAAALKAAEAEEVRARQTGQAARGLGTAGLSAAGLRAQVLAASGPFIIGTVIATFAKKAIEQSDQLEQSLNVLGATTGATKEQMEQMRDAALKLGADLTLPSTSAADAADAMLQLSRAGLSVKDSIEASRGVLQLATAAQVDNATATQITASALNAFGLAGDQATHVADVLANSANASQGSIEDMGIALRQSAAVAHQVGLSFENTQALLTEFARAGLQGSDAGTSLRTALIRLIAPTEQAQAAIDELGIKVRDAQGHVRPDVFVQFGEATKKMSNEARDAFAALIFGQDAIRAVSIGAAQGARGLSSAQREMAKEGTAAKLAKAQTEGLKGSLDGLISNLQTFAINTSGILPVLETFVNSISDIVGGINDLSSALEKVPHLKLSDIINIDIPIPDIVKRALGVSGGGGAAQIKPEDLGLPPEKNRSGLRLGRIAKSVLTADIFRQVGIEAQLTAQGKFGEIGSGELPSETRDRLKAEADFQAKLFTGTATSAKQTSDALTNLFKKPLPIISKFDELTTKALDPAKFDPFLKANQKTNADKFFSAQRAALADTLKFDLKQMQDANLPQNLRDQARDGAEAIIKQFARIGPAGALLLGQAGKQIGEAFGNSLRDAINQFTGLDLFIPAQLPAEITERIKTLQKTPEGRSQLLDIQSELQAQLNQQKQASLQQVQNAQQALADAVTQGNKAVASAIQQGEQNLTSLGDSVGQALQDALVAPIDAQIAAIDKELDQLHNTTSRRDIVQGIKQAGIAVRDFQASVANVGPLTRAQQQLVNEGLDPLFTSLQDNQDQLTEFNLNLKKTNLEKTKEDLQKAAQDGVQRLVKQFLAGKIGVKDFTKTLNQDLAPALRILKTQAGKNLGLSFSTKFKQDIQDLVNQAEALVGFLGGPTPDTAVHPSEAVAAKNKSIKSAQQNLQAAIDAQKLTAKRLGQDGPIVKVLKAINTAVHGRDPFKQPAKVPARRTSPTTTAATGAAYGPGSTKTG